MRNRICSLEYINTQLDLSDLRDVEKPIEDNDMLQWNESTQLWETTTTITGITLASPWTLAGDGFWTGLSEWDISGGNKIIAFGATNTFSIEDTNGLNFLQFRGVDNNIFFGNPTDNTQFDFLGSGIANFAGPIEVDQIGPNDGTDPDLIEIATGQVNINGDVVIGDSAFATPSSLSVFGEGLSNIERSVPSNGNENTRVLDLKRYVGAASQDGDGVVVRYGVTAGTAGSQILNVYGSHGFNRMDTIDMTRFFIRTVDPISGNEDRFAITSDGANFLVNTRIGDTTAPTEALEVNGNIVQSEANGSRYLLRYSLMGA
jgi:hypothetical protein